MRHSSLGLSVVSSRSWPRIFFRDAVLTPFFTQFTAKLCLKTCGVTGLVITALFATFLTILCAVRVEKPMEPLVLKWTSKSCRDRAVRGTILLFPRLPYQPPLPQTTRRFSCQWIWSVRSVQNSFTRRPVSKSTQTTSFSRKDLQALTRR